MEPKNRIDSNPINPVPYRSNQIDPIVPGPNVQPRRQNPRIVDERWQSPIIEECKFKISIKNGF